MACSKFLTDSKFINPSYIRCYIVLVTVRLVKYLTNWIIIIEGCFARDNFWS